MDRGEDDAAGPAADELAEVEDHWGTCMLGIPAVRIALDAGCTSGSVAQDDHSGAGPVRVLQHRNAAKAITIVLPLPWWCRDQAAASTAAHFVMDRRNTLDLRLPRTIFVITSAADAG